MPKRKQRVAGCVLLLLVLVWAGIGLAIAGAGDCVRACNEQYGEDLGVCAGSYAQAMSEASAARSECFAAATWPMDYIRCNATYESAKAHAYVEKVTCEHQANASAAQCVADCAQSPAAP